MVESARYLQGNKLGKSGLFKNKNDGKRGTFSAVSKIGESQKIMASTNEPYRVASNSKEKYYNVGATAYLS